MIASLPMYDWPELRQATDQWWAGIARHAGVSLGLTRGPDHSGPWRSPALLFSQTCGFPFSHEFRGRLKLVATPHYATEGCSGPLYSSFVLAGRKLELESFRGAVAAVNAADSMSGMLALKAVFHRLADRGAFFGSAVATGGHLASLAAVREGRADICAIDAVCVGLARRYRPDLLEGLVEIARSPLVPGLPYVTVGGDVDVLRRALTAAMADPALAEARARLLIGGVSFPEASAPDASVYDAILDLEREIEARGGLQLL